MLSFWVTGGQTLFYLQTDTINYIYRKLCSWVLLKSYRQQHWAGLLFPWHLCTFKMSHHANSERFFGFEIWFRFEFCTSTISRIFRKMDFRTCKISQHANLFKFQAILLDSRIDIALTPSARKFRVSFAQLQFRGCFRSIPSSCSAGTEYIQS